MSKLLPPELPTPNFIKGLAPERITASEDPRLAFVGLHGEEEIAALVEHRVQTERPDLMAVADYKDGNPKARAKGVRAQSPLDDLNRSFRLTPDHPRYYSPERKLADDLLPFLNGYDYVLDLHTSETECGRFFLVAQPEHPAVRGIIASSNIDRVVVMPPQVTAHSLIGNVAQSVSIEYNDALAREPSAVDEIFMIIDGLKHGISERRKREFFYVEHAVPKANDPGDVQNFELCSDGYYPVLFGVGPKSYRNDPSKAYLGFAAQRIEEVVL